MDCKEVRRLYYSFTSEETGQILDIIMPVKDAALWVKGSPNYKLCGKIPNSLRMHLIKHIDTKHAKGK